MVELSNEEREKIYLEEKVRHEARKALELEDEKERSKCILEKERLGESEKFKKKLDFSKIPFFFLVPFLLVFLGTYEKSGGLILPNAIFAGVFFGIILSAIFGFKKKSADNVSTSSSVKSPNEMSSNNSKGEIVVENGLWECKNCHIKMLLAGDYCSKCRRHKQDVAKRYDNSDYSQSDISLEKEEVINEIIYVENGLWECNICHIKMLLAGDFCSKCRRHKKDIAVRKLK